MTVEVSLNFSLPPPPQYTYIPIIGIKSWGGEFVPKTDSIFGKSIRKGIKWYVHFNHRPIK